jgi:hypothetical protein
MRVDLVDPSAFTPPYDRALAAALARRAVDVRLVTTGSTTSPPRAAPGGAWCSPWLAVERAGKTGLEFGRG